MSGEVVEVNDALKAKAEQVNADPHGSWLIVLKFANPAELAALLDAAQYTESGEMNFAARHIGPSADERRAMLDAIGVPNLDVLIGESIPAGIRRAPLDLPEGVSEHRYLRELRETASRNQVFTLVHRPRVLRLRHAARHPAQRHRESWLVYAVHALPGRDRAGTPGSAC